MRNFLRHFDLGWIAVVGLVAAGCDVQPVLNDLAGSARPDRTASTGPAQPDFPQAAPAQSGDTIRVASFNIQVFGTSKMGKPEVMDTLAQVVRRFDVVAIQEVRSKDQTILPRFVEMINADGSQYGFEIGPRLGRTTSKEQYAFVYDTTKLEVVPGSVYTVDDPDDLLHREPMVARFRVRGLPTEEAFSFTLVNIHTDPDETDWELDALDDALVSVRHNGSGEDDCILLGDLNVDQDHLGELGQLPGITWVIRGQPTNTRQDHSYDNLVFDAAATVEFTGYGGVFNLMAEYGLSEDQALDVSDHLPVWAEFSVYEGRPATAIASRPDEGPR